MSISSCSLVIPFSSPFLVLNVLLLHVVFHFGFLYLVAVSFVFCVSFLSFLFSLFFPSSFSAGPRYEVAAESSAGVGPRSAAVTAGTAELAPAKPAAPVRLKKKKKKKKTRMGDFW